MNSWVKSRLHRIKVFALRFEVGVIEVFRPICPEGTVFIEIGRSDIGSSRIIIPREPVQFHQLWIKLSFRDQGLNPTDQYGAVRFHHKSSVTGSSLS